MSRDSRRMKRSEVIRMFLHIQLMSDLAWSSI